MINSKWCVFCLFYTHFGQMFCIHAHSVFMTAVKIAKKRNEENEQLEKQTKKKKCLSPLCWSADDDTEEIEMGNNAKDRWSSAITRNKIVF